MKKICNRIQINFFLQNFGDIRNSSTPAIRSKVAVKILWVLAFLIGLWPRPLLGQALPSGTIMPLPSRIELFLGTSYLNLLGSSNSTYADQPSQLQIQGGVSVFFNSKLGLQSEFSSSLNGHRCIQDLQVGPILRLPIRRFTPFVRAIGGGTKIGGPSGQSCSWGWVVTGGIGVDYVLPFARDLLAIRLQADQIYSSVSFTTPSERLRGGLGQLGGGVILRLRGRTDLSADQLACPVSPVDVYAGDPVTARALGSSAKLSRRSTYVWSTSGGVVSSAQEEATIGTEGLAPGDYSVSVNLIHPGDGRNALRCVGEFRVHAFAPPTVRCTALPEHPRVDEQVVIAAAGESPEQRPLLFSFSASKGEMRQDRTTAILTALSSDPGGVVTVTCKVTDDRGQTAIATREVRYETAERLQAGHPLPSPEEESACTVSYEKDQTFPTEGTGDFDACLRRLVSRMMHDSTNNLVLIGRHSADELPEIAAQRTVRMGLYLVDQTNVDGSRILARTEGVEGRTETVVLRLKDSSTGLEGTSPMDRSFLEGHHTVTSSPASKHKQ